MIKYYHLAIAANLNDSRSEIHTDNYNISHGDMVTVSLGQKSTLHCKGKGTPTILKILNYTVWRDYPDRTAFLPVINMQQLWNYQVVESVMDTEKFLNLFLSPQSDGPFRKQETKLGAIWTIFLSWYFVWTRLWKTSIEKTEASVPKSGNYKDLQRYSSFPEKQESAYSAKSSRVSWRGPEFFAVDLELIMWNKH